jgi:hypothetical protein
MTIMAKDLAGLAWDIWYVSNKAYVAKELCVNKTRPQMHCNGKCHLAKQLQKLEEGVSNKAGVPAKEKAPSPKQSKTREISWITAATSLELQTEQVLPVLKSADGWMEPCGSPQALARAVFHPPVS